MPGTPGAGQGRPNAHVVLSSLKGSYELSSRWALSEFAWLKRLLPAQKGRVGEALFAGLAEAAGVTLTPRCSPGHDCRVGALRVEVKLSTSYDTADPSAATAKWLQIRPAHDFDVLALLAICPEHVHLWLVPKRVAVAHAIGQHGGRGATETKMLEVDPDAAPSWLGADLANQPGQLHRAIAECQQAVGRT